MVLYFGGDLLPGIHILEPPTALHHILWADGHLNPHWPMALQLFGVGLTRHGQEASKNTRVAFGLLPEGLRGSRVAMPRS